MTNQSTMDRRTTNRNLEIYFGALCDPIAEQLVKQGAADFDAIDIHHFQLDADAITRLSVRGLIPDGQRRQLHTKLFTRIIKHLEKRLQKTGCAKA